MFGNTPANSVASEIEVLAAVVAMLGAALEYGKATGEWTWWRVRLLDFVLADNLVGLLLSLSLPLWPAQAILSLIRVGWP